MTAISAFLSALHLLALAIGLAAVGTRGRALSGVLDAAGLRRVFQADTAWGVAAFLWITTGPLRALTSIEKGADYYLHNRLFHLKIGLFLLVFLIELWPMVTFMGWRRAVKRGDLPDLSRARTFVMISRLEAALVVTIVFVASFMARGFGAQ